MPIERKYERDLDLLLAEEFAVNPAFAERFKALTKFASEPATIANFWVSKSDSLGESDLIVVYQRGDGSRFGLLIEDKVDANFQPDQAQRYRLRANRDRSDGVYADFELVLCAPDHYLQSRNDLDGFDRQISLEQIAEMLDAEGDARAAYRAGFLKTAGTKRINAWVREDDIATNAFWDAAYDLASHHFPILELKPLKLTRNSAWITIRPHDLPTMPKHVYVSLKGDKGRVDLTFANTTAHMFQQLIKEFLEPKMTVHQTGAAAAIRLKSPEFTIANGIDEGIPKVKAAFEASSRLIQFYRAFRPELDQHAKASTPA
ncbi:hypothetical protein ABIG06_007333 [Bradyrhizobium sp. USDA 326]|uniref:hypothetical protein n=1 Tax=unclassified Bradyrhizobium TaxID=2631580 RepID=UPI0035125F4E